MKQASNTNRPAKHTGIPLLKNENIGAAWADGITAD